MSRRAAPPIASAVAFAVAVAAAIVAAGPRSLRAAPPDTSGEAITQLRGRSGGRVNWTRAVAIGRGFAGPDLRAPSVTVGRIGAERAAREAAGQSLCRAVRDVPVTAGQTIGQSGRTGVPRGKLDALCSTGAKVADLKVYSDGAVEVLLEAPLDEAIAAIDGQAPAQPPRATLIVTLPKGAKARPTLRLKLVDEAGAPVAMTPAEPVRWALTEGAARRVAAGKVAVARATRTGRPAELVVARGEIDRALGELGEAGRGARLVVVGPLDDEGGR